MAQRDNMPEGTDSIIDGASGSSGSSSGTGYGGGSTGGTGGTGGGTSYAGGLGTAGGAGYGGGLGTGADAMGAASGADLGSGSDFGSNAGTGGSSTTAFGSSSSTGGMGGSSGGDTGSSSGGGLSGGVANLKSQATDKARQAAVQGKDRATDALGNVSTLVRDAAQMVDERLGNGYGEYARKAASAIDGLSDQLRNKEVDELLDDARGFIRKSPGVAIGIAATAGFLLVRVLKAGTGGAMGSTGTGTGSTGYAANDGATPPMVESRGGVA